jgi:predicted homoserine dehydrogenase-like protein
MTVRLGIVGTGFIVRNFLLALERYPGYTASRILSRRAIDSCSEFPAKDLLTNSVDTLLRDSDVVLEATGDVLHATDVIGAAMDRGLPVVTMNTEFHVTTGSYFADKGLLSEAEGDQPGCQAALKEEAEELGFKPLVYGNMKGFQNLDPTPEDMDFWGKKQGISLAMVTSFTDGTKVQAEQALVANGLGGTIAKPGLLGLAMDDLREAGDVLAGHAHAAGMPISEYVLSRTLPHGVFIVGSHDERQRDCLAYLKLGEGPNYVVQKTNIFVHLEIMKTVKRVVEQQRILFNNSATPRVGVATIAKRDLAPGTQIENGIGCFDVRGECVLIRDSAGHVPIGLMRNATIARDVPAGQTLSLDDVELPDSLALTAWKEIEARVLRAEAATGAPAAARATG